MRSARLSPGRVAAGRALIDCERGRHADRALAQHAPAAGPDRGLAWYLVLGVLRRRGELDALITHLARRPVERIDPEALAALRIGLLELRHARTRPHAAVDQAVQLVAALGGGRARGFVNAVLRRSEGVELALPPTINHPDWLVRRWTERFGEEAAAAWCALNDTQAPLALVLRGGERGERGLARLREAGLSLRPAESGGRAPPGCWFIDGYRGAVESLPGFEEGDWWVMDPSAAAAADLLDVRPGERVLDACAAPGGKALRMADRGARITATDRSAERLVRLSENARRAGVSITARAVDWLETPAERAVGAVGAEPFDAALVDAPCTGLGTLRRHPEIRWSRAPTDPAAMALRQLPLLERVAERIRPGGRLVYAVCSAEPEEGRQIAARFVVAHPDFSLDATFECAPPAGDEDAFYAARFVRAPR